MADPDNQAPAEPGQAAEAEAPAAAAAAAAAPEEVMGEGGAEGGDCARAAARPAPRPVRPAPAAAAAAESAARPKNDFLDSLPNSVKCRVLALKKLQKRCDKIEAKFDKEFQALEKKYNDIYKPLLAKIQELTGEMEGCAWTLEGDDDDDDTDTDYDDADDGDDDGEDDDEAAGAAAAKGRGHHGGAAHDAKK